MSKLEPTRTYSNPTANDILRRMLDERGVEYVAEDEPSVGLHFTSWDADGFMWEADDRDERIYLSADRLITPEQAIAATLGSCNCSNNCTSSERTGTCHADETDTWECVCDGIGNYGKRLTVHVMECTECGHVYEHVNGDYEYCPRCGRKRKDVSE